MKRLILVLVLGVLGASGAQADNYTMCLNACYERDCRALSNEQEHIACIHQCMDVCEGHYPYDPFEWVELEAKDENMTPIPEEEIEA